MTDSKSAGTIFDTSAVIGLAERRSAELTDIVKRLGRPIGRSVTVAGELRHGASVTDRPGHRDRLRTLERYERLSAWPDLEVPLHDVGNAYGEVSAIATANSVATGMNDRWIIAECMTQAAGLITADRRQARLAELVAEQSAADFDVVLVEPA